MSNLTKIDKAVTTFRHYAKPVSVRVADIARKVEMSANDQVWVGSLTALLESGEKLCQSVKGQMDAAFGKLPPQDTALEAALLGTLIMFTSKPTHQSGLLTGPAIDEVKSFLKPEHFYIEAHRLVYGAVLTLREAGEGFGMHEVVNKLRSTGNLEQIGGAHYIADLTSRSKSNANLAFEGHVLIEMAMRREMIMECGRTIAACHDDTQDVFEIFEFKKQQDKIIESWIK